MKGIKNIGLVVFLAMLTLFTLSLFLTQFAINAPAISQLRETLPPKAYLSQDQSAALLQVLEARDSRAANKLFFLPAMGRAIDEANDNIGSRYQVDEQTFEQYLSTAMTQKEGQVLMTTESREQANQLLPEAIRQTVIDYTGWLIDRGHASEAEFRQNATSGVKGAIDGAVGMAQIGASKRSDVLFEILKATGTGFFWTNKTSLFWLLFGLGIAGALMYMFPAFFDSNPGIKHNHIYHESHSSRGLLGYIMGFYLVAFYVLLYFKHQWLTEWITLVDRVAQFLRGEDASRWFMYGFLYTVVILVMGVRMLSKYRHSRYQQVRTLSVMFFQTAFAFVIPQLLYVLNLPEMDLKNSWPLNYTFFFDYNIGGHIESGTFGIFLLGWGIALFAIGVPLFTYFYGKRWYCSWVCGCGGLAETLGDPWRQLSDKTTEAWQVERALIHAVLVFAVLMTGYVLYAFFAENISGFGMNRWLILGLFWASAAGLFLYHRKKYPDLGRNKILVVMGVILFGVSYGVISGFLETGQSQAFVSHDNIKSIYGFAIGSMFAGVIGTGLYPILGNRPWCRFGCPLAAYLGIIQRFKSRFRITTNGGQCISCGNCSTYCEMGIDVRAYAQRGQNIVRASCVGCGVCAAVCPRGVLSLENLSNDDFSRMEEVRY
jgi:ferredoxin-type protein NapH